MSSTYYIEWILLCEHVVNPFIAQGLPIWFILIICCMHIIHGCNISNIICMLYMMSPIIAYYICKFDHVHFSLPPERHLERRPERGSRERLENAQAAFQHCLRTSGHIPSQEHSGCMDLEDYKE